MKTLVIMALFCLGFTNKIYSAECDNGVGRSELQLDPRRKYICYEFGFCNLIDIYIAEGNSLCDVLILDGKGKCVSTTCRKSPLLSWAFDDMSDEITEPQVIEDNNYKPYYYKLSILKGSSRKILSSSALSIDYSDDVNRKIEELKAFIINLWASNCIKGNSSIDGQKQRHYEADTLHKFDTHEK